MLRDNYTIRETKRVQKDRNIIITVILLFLVMQVPGLILGIAGSIYLANTNPDMLAQGINLNLFLDDRFLVASLFITLPVALAVYIFAKKYLNRNNESLGLTHPEKGKNYIKGLTVGFLMMAVSVLILKIFGMIDMRANFSNVSPMLFILFIIGWIIQGFEEELLTRAVMMNLFAAKSGVVVGIVANSLIFSILHLGNNAFTLLPFINLFLVGILYSLMFYVSDDIFFPAAAHSIWNFAQGNLFGIPVSGSYNISNTLIKSDLTGNPFMTGGDFGVEGGLVVTLVHIIVIAVLIKMAKDKSDREFKKDETIVIESNGN